MISYLLLVVFLSSSLSAVAEETAKEEIKPQIGSMDDSGRVDPDEYEFSNAENKLWMDKRVILGDVANDNIAELKDINRRETFILSALAIAVLFFGLYPAPLFDAMHPTLEHLFEHLLQTKTIL